MALRVAYCGRWLFTSLDSADIDGAEGSLRKQANEVGVASDQVALHLEACSDGSRPHDLDAPGVHLGFDRFTGFEFLQDHVECFPRPGPGVEQTSVSFVKRPGRFRQSRNRDCLGMGYNAVYE